MGTPRDLPISHLPFPIPIRPVFFSGLSEISSKTEISERDYEHEEVHRRH
jgi:hypothetical protein